MNDAEILWQQARPALVLIVPDLDSRRGGAAAVGMGFYLGLIGAGLGAGCGAGVTVTCGLGMGVPCGRGCGGRWLGRSPGLWWLPLVLVVVSL